MQRLNRFIAALLTVCCAGSAAATTYPWSLGLGKTPAGGVEAQFAEHVIATYVPGDEVTHRPYFANLKTRVGGVPVTRNHPPSGNDPTDHATMHPGVWMAFADLGGRDFWRNKGPRVVQETLTIDQKDHAFRVVNRYV